MVPIAAARWQVRLGGSQPIRIVPRTCFQDGGHEQERRPFCKRKIACIITQTSEKVKNQNEGSLENKDAGDVAPEDPMTQEKSQNVADDMVARGPENWETASHPNRRTLAQHPHAK